MSSHRYSIDLHDLCPREIDIEVCSKTLKIYQKVSDSDVNSVVWDSSIVLAKYLEIMCQDMPNFLKDLKILELGSGLGLVGLTAGTLGAQVTLTDLPEALSLLRVNIAENKNQVMCLGGYAVAEALNWGDLNSGVLQSMVFDYVLLADCIYYEESVDALMQTLVNVNTSVPTDPVILITQEIRDSDSQRRLWKIFYEKLRTHFDIVSIPEAQHHPEYRSSDIILLRATKKKQK